MSEELLTEEEKGIFDLYPELAELREGRRTDGGR